MYYLSEQHLLIFLLQIFVLLLCAKIAGHLSRKMGQPPLVGEIIIGILLGPSIFGRIAPLLYSSLFPNDPIQQSMLDTVAWLGAFFLLLITGFEVNISTAWKQGKTALTIGVVGVIIPLSISLVVFLLSPGTYLHPSASTHFITALFLGVAVSISAIPVLARLLHDLKLLKTDLGLMLISAFTINDLLGWLLFTAALGLASKGTFSTPALLHTITGIIVLTTLSLTLGTKIIRQLVLYTQRSDFPQPGSTLSLITLLALIMGSITQKLGIHAIFGFFLAGIVAGDVPEIPERTKEIAEQMVQAVFVPLFFVTIGLKVDFIENLNIPLAILITFLAIGGKFIGAYIGARWAKLSPYEALPVGIAHIPGGAMEMIVGILAMEYEIISVPAFEAITIAALVSSILVGPLLTWSIRYKEKIDISRFLLPKTVLLTLQNQEKESVILELCQTVVQGFTFLDNWEDLAQRVIERERIMGTGLENGVAIPHARIKALPTPVVALGISREGIEWNTPDGKPVHFVFLVITPQENPRIQIQLLSEIARIMAQEEIRNNILRAQTPKKIISLIKRALSHI